MSTVDWSSHDEIRALLMGRTVIKIDGDRLALDDGTELQIVPNTGDCSCGAGDYEIAELNDCPVNMIMAVEFEEVGEGFDDKWGEGDRSYRVFVLAEDRRIKLLQVDGDDGNGYYGTGYWIVATKPGGAS